MTDISSFTPFEIKFNYNLPSIVKYERINYPILRELINNDEIMVKYDYSPEEQGFMRPKNCSLKSILKKIKSNTNKKGDYFVTTVIYKQKMYLNEASGRFISDGCAGLQMIEKHIRHTLSHEYYNDYDFKNCHPTILSQLCKYNNWQCSSIDDYNENRVKYLEELANYNYTENSNITIDDAKMDVLKILNGGNFRPISTNSNPEEKRKEFNNKFKWLINLKKEIEKIHELVWIYYPKYSNIVKEKCSKNKRKDYNQKGSCFNHLLCDIENQCLLAFQEFLQINNFEPDVLCFDGIMVQKNEDLNEEVLREAENYIYQKTKFKLKIVEKPMNNILNINNNDNDDNIIVDTSKCKTYDEVKKKFEKNHFKVINISRFVKINNTSENNLDDKLSFFSKKDFSIAYEELTFDYYNEKTKQIEKINFLNGNSKVDGWYKDKNKRIYEKIEFYPPPMVCPKNVYNLWNGFRINSVPLEDNFDIKNDYHINLFLEYIKNLLPNDYEFLLKMVAQIIQEPAKKNNISAIIKGCYGSGKDTFIFMLKQMLGHQLVWIGKIDDFFEKHTNSSGKLLIVFSELSGTSSRKHWNAFKDGITRDSVSVNPKNEKAFFVKCYARFMSTTNSENPAPITEDERRLVPFETSTYYTTRNEFFVDFYKEIVENDIALRKIFEYFKTIDYSNINWIKDRPITPYKLELIESNRPIIIRFLSYIIFYIDNYKQFIDNKCIIITANNLYDKFIDFKENIMKNKKEYGNLVKFSIELNSLIRNKGINSIEKKSKKNGAPWSIDIFCLANWLLQNDIIVNDDLLTLESKFNSMFKKNNKIIGPYKEIYDDM